MAYAVVDFGPDEVETAEVEVLGFRMALEEAFAMLMSLSVGEGSYRFARDAAGMRMDVEAPPGPRTSLPCDDGGANAFASTNTDDDEAVAEIMRRVGDMSWHGLSLAPHEGHVPGPDFLKTELEAELRELAAAAAAG